MIGGRMDAAAALQELTEISSQIGAAALFRADGSVEATTLAEGRGDAFVRAARALLDAAAEGREVQQLEVATAEGSVFVVRDGERAIAATTAAEPTVGLVFYDLKSCLRTVTAAELEAQKPKRPRKKKENGASG
jgi:predicted regulator of Ras-like GTPase activity (Roadblock/LC7/MglB family)